MSSQASIQDSMGFWISRLARTMEQDFEKRLGAMRITRGAYAVLSAIYHDGKTTPAEIAGFLGVDGAAITRHLDRLEDRGFIKRTPSATDRRSTIIDLTPEGIEAVRRGRADSNRTNEKFTDALTAADVDRLQSIIQRMLANANQAVTDI